ncbi:MAG: hypothetical protein FJ387_27665 [Verrucomicrobia bacterium]|nr:hypothetical protein [Verrucomicrobiota bacterium]
MNTAALVLVSAMAAAVCGAAPEAASIVTNLAGRDWSLPPATRETPNAGWAWCNSPDFAREWQKKFPIESPPDTLHFCGYKYLIWADVNPAPGQYNWEAVDKWVAQMTAVPHQGFAFYPAVFSRMLNGDQGTYTGKQYMVPHWLETEGWQGRNVRFYKDGEPTGWEPDSGYLGALEAFLKAVAERYAKHPRFAYIDIRCIDHVYGEGQLQRASTKAKIDDLEKNYGYSPERYEAYMRALFDLYARVFPGQEAKCVIQTMGPYMAGPPGRYDAASERAWLYGFSKGFGGRDGLVESWMQYLNLGNGCSVDPVTRHLVAEEEWHPVLKAWDTRGQGPVWLTENEEWGADSDRGPKENEATGWFVSNLRALQMRRNWIGLSIQTVWRDVPMSRYFQLSLGKTRAASPDAWCWLRESGAFGQWFQYPDEKKTLGTGRMGPTNGWLAQHFGYPREYEYINSERGAGKVINFERWLMQFDTAPDGMTRPALRTHTSQKAWDRKDRSPDKLWGQSHGGATGDAEYWARRTDHATGQDAIYLKADPKWFQSHAGPARLFVTYQDTHASSWRVEYQDQSGARQHSPTITTADSGELRTVTFELPSLAARGGFAGSNDFRLVRLSGGDLVVQLVRLAKWDATAPKSLSNAQTTAPHQPAEDDWWLPDWVKPVPNSGIYGAQNAPQGFVDVEHVVLPWGEIEPREGVYDWSLLTVALSKGRPVWVRFFASDVSHCPEWLARKYPDLKRHRYRWPDGGYDDITGYIHGQTTVRSAGDFYEVWDPRFEAEFRRFLDAFAQAGFGRDPRIRFAYFPHAFRWNEYSLKWVPEMAKAGFTPEQYVAWFKRTLADYVAAFDGDAGRIVYTGTGNREWIEWTGDDASFKRWDRAINLPDGGNVLSQACLNLGAGVRDGFTEAFNRFSWRPDWGLDLVTEGGYRYSVINESHPLISADRRFFGTENEDFDYLWPNVKHYHWLKLSTLNMLRLRMNWLFLGDYRVAPDLLQYMRRTMGRKVHESPDAWVALRQYRDPYLVDDQRGDGTENIRNFERWLYQRDLAPDGRTVAVERIEPPEKFRQLNGGSWEALRTDHRNGSDRIYFNVDDRFLKGGRNRVLVKVTYLDNHRGPWQLEYDAGEKAPHKPAKPVVGIGDGKWRTVTVELEDAAFENRQHGWADFRLRNDGHSDLTVRFVRLIKPEPPAHAAREGGG